MGDYFSWKSNAKAILAEAESLMALRWN